MHEINDSLLSAPVFPVSVALASDEEENFVHFLISVLFEECPLIFKDRSASNKIF